MKFKPIKPQIVLSWVDNFKWINLGFPLQCGAKSTLESNIYLKETPLKNWLPSKNETPVYWNHVKSYCIWIVPGLHCKKLNSPLITSSILFTPTILECVHSPATNSCHVCTIDEGICLSFASITKFPHVYTPEEEIQCSQKTINMLWDRSACVEVMALTGMAILSYAPSSNSFWDFW